MQTYNYKVYGLDGYLNDKEQVKEIFYVDSILFN